MSRPDGAAPTVSAPTASAPRAPSLSAGLVRGLVRAYQVIAAGRPSRCRYYPSCSTYAVEALERHGALRGSALTARRLARCHPWGGHGVDLVPE